MNFLNLIQKVKCYERGRIRYYYLEYTNNNDDINKTYSIFIGLVRYEEGVINDYEYIRYNFLDEYDKIHSGLYGYSCYINCDIKVNVSYTIYGESQGNHIIEHIDNINNGMVNAYLDEVNYYTTVKLSKDRLIQMFWKLNKDWLVKIR